MYTKARHKAGILVFLLVLSFIVAADSVVNDDQIITQSLCVGADCEDGEEFDFDTVRLKADDARIRFQDTSNSGAFPTNDWLMGITDNGGSGPFLFYIRDVSNDSIVLLLESGASGGVALGPDAALEANAVSVGAEGAERRIVNVAEGTDDNDGVNMAQFNAFASETEAGLADEKSAIDADIAGLQDQINALSNRVDDLLDRVEDL